MAWRPSAVTDAAWASRPRRRPRRGAPVASTRSSPPTVEAGRHRGREGRAAAASDCPATQRPVERAHHRVRHLAPALRGSRCCRGRVHAVREQDDVELALGVDPDRGAGEAGVAEGASREERARGRVARAARRRAARPDSSVGVSQPRARVEPGPGPAVKSSRSRGRRSAGRRNAPARRASARSARGRGRCRRAPRGGRRRRGRRRSRRAPRRARPGRARDRSRWARCGQELRPAAGTGCPSCRGARGRAGGRRPRAARPPPAPGSRRAGRCRGRCRPTRPRLVDEVHGLDALEVRRLRPAAPCRAAPTSRAPRSGSAGGTP